MDLIIHLVQALFGGTLVLLMRNDTIESLGDLNLKKGFWLILAAAMTLGLGLIKYDPWQANLLALVAAWLWSDGHNWILSPPGQILGNKEDEHRTRPSKYLDAALLFIGEKHVADEELGLTPWFIASALRYWLPCVGAFWITGNGWLVLAGPLIIFGYWPVAWWLERLIKSDTKFIGAFLAGAIFYGVL